MIEFTREQQLINIDLAESIWRERVTPDKVHKELSDWGCGSTACFGGHVATWPEFHAMGVRQRKEFGYIGHRLAPALDLYTHSLTVAGVLFGDPDLFEVRGYHPADPSYSPERQGFEARLEDPSVSDYDLVLRRLAHARRKLQDQAE